MALSQTPWLSIHWRQGQKTTRDKTMYRTTSVAVVGASGRLCGRRNPAAAARPSGLHRRTFDDRRVDGGRQRGQPARRAPPAFAAPARAPGVAAHRRRPAGRSRRCVHSVAARPFCAAGRTARPRHGDHRLRWRFPAARCGGVGAVLRFSACGYLALRATRTSRRPRPPAWRHPGSRSRGVTPPRRCWGWCPPSPKASLNRP